MFEAVFFFSKYFQNILSILRFDICEEFANEAITEPIRLTNKFVRNTNYKKVACIDSILDNMRKNYENERQFEEDELKQQKQQEEEQKALQDTQKDDMFENDELVIESSIDYIVSSVERLIQLETQADQIKDEEELINFRKVSNEIENSQLSNSPSANL
jgi:hypothetical protein